LQTLNFEEGEAVLLPRPGYCLRSISLFVYIFLCFFVIKITRKRLDRFASNFQGRCGVTMARPDYIFRQFRETARCLEAQQRDGVCCAFTPQIVIVITASITTSNIIYIFIHQMMVVTKKKEKEKKT